MNQIQNVLNIIDKHKGNINDNDYLTLCNNLKTLLDKMEKGAKKEMLIHKLYIIGYKEWRYYKINNIWELKCIIKERLLMSSLKEDIGEIFKNDKYVGQPFFIDEQSHFFGLLNYCSIDIKKSLLSNQEFTTSPYRKTQIINEIEVEIPLPQIVYTKEFYDPEQIKYS